MAADKKIEEGLDFTPRFDSNGLITAISQDANTNDVLMVAYMNEEALKLTIETGNAVFFSRSRQKLWKKGEQSGHIVFLDYNTTGDGMITALQVLALMQKTGKSLKELASCMDRFPQALVNVSVKRKEPFENIPLISERIAKAEERLGKDGRILVRYSGTEPLARVMVEGLDQAEIAEITESVAAAIAEELG